MNPFDAISAECFRSFSILPNAWLLDEKGVFGVITKVPLTFFNGIAHARVERDDVPRIIETFRAVSRPFRWWISPDAAPPDLDAVLHANGMRHCYDAPGMTADLTSLRPVPPPAELTIERVTELDDWLTVFIRGFDLHPAAAPAWREAYRQCESWVHFVGFVDGTPAATTSLLLAGDLAGVYHVVTLPPFRGRGIGAAMTSAALQHARHAGAKTAVLQSSEMGFRVYQSVGFEAKCTLTLYDWRPE